MIPEAADLGAGLPAPLKRAYERTYRVLVDERGCDVYVKTIYVGFSIDGAMVAAVYPHSKHFEIALALPEEVEGREFKDATHLTWPTMPVSLEVCTETDLLVALGHINTAAERVRTGQHYVRRPNEHFIGRINRGINKSIS